MKGSKIYLVFDDSDGNYWQQFKSLEDAVSECGDGCEVWCAIPYLLGKFKCKAEIVKIKQPGKKVKAKK